MSNKVIKSIVWLAHKLFDWRTVYNPITYRLYPELYRNSTTDEKIKQLKRKIEKLSNR